MFVNWLAEAKKALDSSRSALLSAEFRVEKQKEVVNARDKINVEQLRKEVEALSLRLSVLIYACNPNRDSDPYSIHLLYDPKPEVQPHAPLI